MPEHLRALIVVLVLAGAAWIVTQPSVARATSAATAQQWRNWWFGFTVVAFAVGSFWLYAAIVAIVLLAQRLKPIDALAAYCLLLFAVPAATVDIPGFGLINYFFTLSQPRLLALLLLAPATLALARQPGRVRLGSTLPDKLLLGYVLLAAVLQLRASNFTSTLRGCFYLVTDVLLIYYVASRAPQQPSDLRRVLQAYVMAAALLGILSVFETLRHWNLYSAMVSTLGLGWGTTGYLSREGLLRANGSVGQAIVLGYVSAVGLGLWLALQEGQRRTLRNLAPALLMGGGLLAALSRGPWVGAVAVLLAFLWTGRNRVQNIAKLGVAGIAGLGLLSLFGAGQKILSFLPFIGTVDSGNVSYRQRLLDNALIVIDRNFWLGSVDYRQTPEMQSMIQGQGIIDIVNTYLGVALNYGIIGLALFAGFFIVILWQLWRTQTRLAMDSELRTMGRSLLATFFAIALMISSVSTIVVVAQVFWLVAGFAVAWLGLMASKRPIGKIPAQPVSAG
ncbi:O-antigen ligase family protein [Comamonas badia]|uniref:O-antigen ligase family protein n=1 Tax=Comamonas badia TaxID=265291 RepID=UPI0004A50021|nr:O-antigen ligase family protein [Comamonas badia]